MPYRHKRPTDLCLGVHLAVLGVSIFLLALVKTTSDTPGIVAVGVLCLVSGGVITWRDRPRRQSQSLRSASKGVLVQSLYLRDPSPDPAGLYKLVREIAWKRGTNIAKIQLHALRGGGYELEYKLEPEPTQITIMRMDRRRSQRGR